MAIGIFPQRASVRRAFGGMAKQLWTDAIAASEQWKRTGDELFKYGYTPGELFGYDNMPERASYGAKIAKTAEAMQQLGSRLAPLSAITRLLRPRSADPALLARTQARSEFLNYTPIQTRFLQQRRQAINDALCWGGGCLWTGLDARTHLPQSIWRPRTRTFIDAGAKMYEDVRCIFDKRVRARAEVMREYPEAAEVIAKMLSYDGKDERDEMKGQAKDKDRVCYYDCYLNHGISQYSGGSEAFAQASGRGGAGTEEEQRQAIIQGKDDPVFCCVTEDGEMFWTGEWPLKFYLMPRDPWPVTFYDLYTGTVPTRPHSPLEAGIGIQRAINHITKLMMANAKVSFRATFATRKQNGKGLSLQAKDRVMNGSDITVIDVDVGAVTDGKLSIRDFVEKIEWSKDFIAPGIAWLQFLETQYERLTPLSQFLNTGQGSVQDRSAAATQVRDRNTLNRVNDLIDMVTEADNVVARKECFLAASKLTRADIAKVMPVAAKNWGILSTPEAKDPAYHIPRIMAGPQFDEIERANPEQAKMIAQQAMDTLPMMPPDVANQIVQTAQMQASQAYTIEEVIYQTDFEIDVSSSRRKDVDQQVESLNVDANSIWPIQLGSGDPRQMALAYDGMATRAKLQGQDAQLVAGYKKMADDLRMQAMAPPPGVVVPLQPGQPAQQPQGQPA